MPTGRSGGGRPVKRKHLIDTQEEKSRARQVEPQRPSDPQSSDSSSWSDPSGRHHRYALKHEEQELPALDSTGGDPKDVFVEQAGYPERDQRGPNGTPGTTSRPKG